jgi:hypothetical protein
MYKFKCVSLLIIFVFAINIIITKDSSARRGRKGKNGYSSRYRTNYRNFNYTVYNHYNYSERRYNSGCRTYLCYEDFNNDPYFYDNDVFIEETIIENGQYYGYTRITVYRTSNYNDNSRVVSYYTHNGRVVRRNFYRRHRYINDPYYYSGYRRVNYVYLDRYTADIIIGMHFVHVGASVLANCRNGDAACAMVALASSMSGSLIAAAASEREERRRTELQERVEYYETIEQDNIIEDSWD